MRRFAVLSFVLLAGPAFAQSVPEATEMDLWCGLAFTIVAAGAPADATDEQKAVIERFADGGRQLTDRARAILLESGYTEESLNDHLDKLRAKVTAEVDSAEVSATYSFEQCAALLPF
jgi:hypothetical protein